MYRMSAARKPSSVPLMTGWSFAIWLMTLSRLVSAASTALVSEIAAPEAHQARRDRVDRLVHVLKDVAGELLHADLAVGGVERQDPVHVEGLSRG